MKFLADENLEYSLISFLRERNIDVVAVRDVMKGASDLKIIEYAFENNLLIITSDKDFGELTFRLKRPNHGIILLRFSEDNSIEKANILWAALKKLNKEAINKFVVVEKNSIRVRSLF
jgi:predicted nuclease of predicted toxin-antitoxin system